MLAESLPNITGYNDIAGATGVNGVASGAFTKNIFAQNTDYQSIASSENGLASSTFNASLSSSTYKDNAPVQQAATVVIFCIKY